MQLPFQWAVTMMSFLPNNRIKAGWYNASAFAPFSWKKMFTIQYEPIRFAKMFIMWSLLEATNGSYAVGKTSFPPPSVPSGGLYITYWMEVSLISVDSGVVFSDTDLRFHYANQMYNSDIHAMTNKMNKYMVGRTATLWVVSGISQWSTIS